MFSTADANQLRQSLTSMVFLHDGTESQLGVGANASGLYAAYAQYYGLNFSELDPALARLSRQHRYVYQWPLRAGLPTLRAGDISAA